MNKSRVHWFMGVIAMLVMLPIVSCAKLEPANTDQGVTQRTIKVNMVVLEWTIKNNRLGAEITNGQMYALVRDVMPLSAPFNDYGDKKGRAYSLADLKPGQVRPRNYKRPRPIVLRANVGDILEITFTNLMPAGTNALLSDAGVQVMGLNWLDDDNGTRVSPGETHVYRYEATGEGVYMMYSPNGESIPNSQLDYGLFGAVNVQPPEAEYYRSQVIEKDMQLATYRVNKDFMNTWWTSQDNAVCKQYLDSSQTGLPENVAIRRQPVEVDNRIVCPGPGGEVLWEMRIPTLESDKTALVSSVLITAQGYLNTQNSQPVINYNAMYPEGHLRYGSPVLNMLVKDTDDGTYELAHSDLTAIITGPGAGRFPYYINSPSFIENPATPDRRQPYREFTIAYHISPHTQQAFEMFNSGPLVNMLAPGKDGFAVNYGIAGIAPEIVANRINVGPQGINKDGVDLLFEEFFLSAWAVGDPAVLVDIPANNKSNKRATRALYPDDPSNVYHSYMRDHVKFRVMNTGSVAPHVHHQHAHQWLHTPNSADGHYLDSQMIAPGSTYTLEMTYNGSGNRNQTVGDSIFHCHIYPHFAQGMWAMWRVHDVFEAGTELDSEGRPLAGARALPDGEIMAGTPIPALVPLPGLAMAPTPAKAYLKDNGRRVAVEPSGRSEDGEPIYTNPGFPFFIPGVAGHRAPHPPLDFAWKENPDKTPKLLSAAEAEKIPFRDAGDIAYLDGGLPRNVVLGGTVDREFHTRWDFTKEVGKMIAMELPETGTAIERAAMDAHATRTHASHLPNGLPGNFILNGLPPSPGAPYAAPEVDDDGNSTFNKRRYKAAVIQTDVVFNKQGWHYPQQRFITLLEDVKDTIAGERPPEPFFFRSETSETVEFWHTNLVPNYYELDDFQVRTPTDILGQHIHLVKFDVTSSDGAANGFNYEDGTFSPSEVQERIEAINKQGGLHLFDPDFQYKTTKQVPLTLSNYIDDYGTSLGKPPPGQNWDGAQTTIQRFGTDPLLNHQGEDRTLRTVFTHDHFGPSTHQQVGLYGALLVEPSGTDWFDAVTGEQFPSESRDDGGPTSWQALIEGHDSAQSFREFAIAMGDLQLAYTADSPSKRSVPQGIWFSTPDVNYAPALNNGEIPSALVTVFENQGAPLPTGATVESAGADNQWLLKPSIHDTFLLTLTAGQINVQTKTISPSWADIDASIWPPATTLLNSHGNPANCNGNPIVCQGGHVVPQNGKPPACGGVTVVCGDSATRACSNGKLVACPDPQPDNDYAPFPTIISNPGGAGNIGIWVSNYRNEPLDSRIQGDSSDGIATDASFAFSSIQRVNPALNTQPTAGAPIGADPDGFKYPGRPLLPEGTGGVQGPDPYTPMLRAYANDNIEVRAIVGAVDSPHSFGIQGVNWHAEPSYQESGFRDVQGMGISEHFEMLFRLPAGHGGSPGPVDRLYASSTSSMGLAKGAWGILRTYDEEVPNLASLSNNPPGTHIVPDMHALPAGRQPDRVFDITISLASTGKSLQYEVDGQTMSPLVLRAAAGDWIQINLTNSLTAEQAAAMTAIWPAGSKSANTSSNTIQPYQASANVGISPRLISYDAATASGLNIGLNGVADQQYQTVAPGEQKSFIWYAGNITLGSQSEPVPTPVEFGAVNLVPSDQLLQASYGLSGALIIEPAGSTWKASEQHALTATINDASGNAMFTEIVISGQSTSDASAIAGTEVRFRVLNPNRGTAGQVGDSANLITIEGHNWPEEPFVNQSTVIGDNPLTQTMGTQQVTSLESYNLVIDSAGGVAQTTGEFDFYYYPKGPGKTKLGTLTVTSQ